MSRAQQAQPPPDQEQSPAPRESQAREEESKSPPEGREEPSEKSACPPVEGSSLPDSIPAGVSLAAEAESGPALEQRESMALLILAILAIIAAMYQAREVLLPCTAGFLLAITLRPIVRRLRRYGLPDIAGAGLTIIVLLSAVLASFTYVLFPARKWVEDAPRHVERIQERVRHAREQMGGVLQLAVPLEEPAEGGDMPVPVEIRANDWTEHLEWITNTGSLLGGLFVVLTFCFFLLAFGDRLINNVLHLLSKWSEKKRAVELVHDVERSVASYLLTVTGLNIALGIAVGFAMWGLGLPHPPLWGLMAFLLNYVPIFGAVVGFIAVLLVSVLTFESLAFAFVPPIVFGILSGLEGNFIAPSILGHSMRMNPILILLSLIFWGWLWGVGGAFLAVPLLAVFQLTCDRFEKSRPVAVLLRR